MHLKSNEQPANKQKHILLTSLSVKPSEVDYCLGDKTVKAVQSPLALVQILSPDQRPDKIIVLCTKKVLEEQYEKVKKAINSLNEPLQAQTTPATVSYSEIEIIDLAIPDGVNTEELWEILRLILKSVPRGCRLTLDLTHGFRSFPFLFFTASLFLKALHNVEICAIYYGMFEAASTYGKPIVDLSPVLDMTEWFYATRIFRETGQAVGLTDLLVAFEKPPAGLSGIACKPYSQVKGLREAINLVSAAYIQALPVEFGIEAETLLERLKNPVPAHLSDRMPLPEELFDEIRDFIKPFALSGMRKENKPDIRLSREELNRQIGIIDTYIEQGYVNFAIGLIREFLVSVAMWWGGIDGKEWLSYGGNVDRKSVERRIGSIQSIRKMIGESTFPDYLTEGQKWLAEHWHFMSGKRNDLHHHGFKKDYGLVDAVKYMQIKNRWQEIKEFVDVSDMWNLQLSGGGGNLLVTPLGLSKGLLFSALCKIKPQHLYVLSSKEAIEHLDEIVLKAGWSGSMTVYNMKDPYGGFSESVNIVKDILSLLLQVDEVVVNITGGTTAMQFIMQKILEQSNEIDRRVSRIALIDRRLPQEQRDKPYVEGELICLDNLAELNDLSLQ